MMALNNLGRLLEMTGPKEMAEPEALYRRVLEKEPRCDALGTGTWGESGLGCALSRI